MKGFFSKCDLGKMEMEKMFFCSGSFKFQRRRQEHLFLQNTSGGCFCKKVTTGVPQILNACKNEIYQEKRSS